MYYLLSKTRKVLNVTEKKFKLFEMKLFLDFKGIAKNYASLMWSSWFNIFLNLSEFLGLKISEYLK